MRRRWAELIRRVYEIDPLVCPKCGSEMKVIGFITEPRVIRRIVDHLKNMRSARLWVALGAPITRGDLAGEPRQVAFEQR